jgi:Raf kinase inhibitor-like YbhB/YbcL family protein
MKRVLLFFGLLMFFAIFSKAQNPTPAAAPANPPMTLTTNAWPDGGIIPIKYSQAAPDAKPGGGTSPEFTWTNIPPGTQSLLFNFHDLDLSYNKTTQDQVHWVVWNIPPTKTTLTEKQPEGAQLPDGSYQISVTGLFYRGPGAAASGPLHHYIFEIYALDTKLNIQPVHTPGADAATNTANAFETRRIVMTAIEGHILGKAAYTGRFRRPQ